MLIPLVDEFPEERLWRAEGAFISSVRKPDMVDPLNPKVVLGFSELLY